MPEVPLSPELLAMAAAVIVVITVVVLLVQVVRLRSDLDEESRRLDDRLRKLQGRLRRHGRRLDDLESRGPGRASSSVSGVEERSVSHGDGNQVESSERADDQEPSHPDTDRGRDGGDLPPDVSKDRSSTRPDGDDGYGYGDDSTDKSGSDRHVDLTDAGFGESELDRKGAASRASEAEQEEDGYSRSKVEQLYADWCERGRRPPSGGAIEVQPMRHAGSVQEDELSEARHRLEDASGTSEFVRFSPVDEGRGLLLPHPDARYNANTHGEFFPDADKQLFAEPSNLTSLEPVEVRRRDDGRWEAVEG